MIKTLIFRRDWRRNDSEVRGILMLTKEQDLFIKVLADLINQNGKKQNSTRHR